MNMKRILVSVIFVFSFAYCTQAQVNPHAIGLRLNGNGDVNGVEISYQQGLGNKNRLELDLGFAGNNHQDRMLFAAIYHWDWKITSGLNWYAGPGAMIGLYSYDTGDYLNIAIGGQIGLEYDFSNLTAPILLSIDARPMWDFIGDYNGLGWGAALGIRYVW